jgi:ribonuclease BN (tRNA processing enzyme)
MKLQFIGTGTFSTVERALTSFLVNDEVLLDAGGGTIRGLQSYGADLGKIKYLVITHFHVDHWPDVMCFLMKRKFMNFEGRPLTIVGPAGIESTVMGAMSKYMGPIFSAENLTFVELTNDKVQLGDYEIVAHDAKHGFCQPVNSYEVVAGDRRLGFSGDSTGCDGLDAVVENSQTLFLDSNSVGASDDWHLNFGGVLDYARTYPDKKFYLVHRGDYDLPDLPENVVAPVDSDIIDL